jgi:3-methyl-2-oxobutanoate hydroxymethyltransferase
MAEDGSAKKKVTLLGLQAMKAKGQRVAWITAYDYPFAYTAEQAGVDMILVGDSGGMVQLGYQTTNPVTMDEMIQFAKAVRKGAPNTFIIGDMPQGAYEVSDEDAVRNALRFVKEAGCDAVKLEGGVRMCPRVKAIADAGILVMGHLGLTPQSAASFGGYRIQGKTAASFEHTLTDAVALERAGAFSILLEAMPTLPAENIAKQLRIPIYGIGAGAGVDGQLVIMHDLMGFYQSFRPWFAKCYVPQVIDAYRTVVTKVGDVRAFGRDTRQDGLLTLARLAIEAYVRDVKSNVFPGEEYSYPLTLQELEELKTSPIWRPL